MNTQTKTKRPTRKSCQEGVEKKIMVMQLKKGTNIYL
jgi:hypothetical protein